MEKIIVSGLLLALIMITSCASTKDEQLVTGGQPNWPVEEANFTTKGEVKDLTAVTTSQTSYKPEIRHKQGYIHHAAR